jgi:hypothetical protein
MADAAERKRSSAGTVCLLVIATRSRLETRTKENQMTSNFVGTWNSAWTGGAHASPTLTIKEDGTGTYNWSNGTLKGKFVDGGLSFSGTWTQSNGSGTFTFVLLGTNTFIGAWGNSTGTPGGQWNGTRNS